MAEVTHAGRRLEVICTMDPCLFSLYGHRGSRANGSSSSIVPQTSTLGNCSNCRPLNCAAHTVVTITALGDMILVYSGDKLRSLKGPSYTSKVGGCGHITFYSRTRAERAGDQRDPGVTLTTVDHPRVDYSRIQ